MKREIEEQRDGMKRKVSEYKFSISIIAIYFAISFHIMA